MGTMSSLAGQVASLLPNATAAAESPEMCTASCYGICKRIQNFVYSTYWLCCQSGCWSQGCHCGGLPG